jgi:signal transduction histidine kinase
MKRLYLKLVAVIWVVMIVSSVGAVSIVRMISTEESIQAITIDRFLKPIVEDLVAAADGGDQDGLLELFRSSVLVTRKMAFRVSDNNGQSLLSVGPPHAIEELESGARGASTWQYEFEHNADNYVLKVLLRDGKRRGPPIRFFKRETPLLVLLIAIALSVTLSMLLARYLIRPLKSFESAGLRLADGDLTARINPSIAHRGDELAEFASTFDHMAERIEKLVNSHKELLRDVSHELRSPLARVHAALSLARQRTNGVVDGELTRVEEELYRLDVLIGKLLVFARLDSGQSRMQRQPIDLAGILLDVVNDSQIEALAEDKTVTYTGAQEFSVIGDAGLLASCFENIVRNAIRHSPRQLPVEVSLSVDASDASNCLVVVRDHGPGVPDSNLSTIFDLFRKNDSDGGENAGSSGIGLAIAEKVVSLHNGGIAAANAPNGGLIVTVRLPLEA